LPKELAEITVARVTLASTVKELAAAVEIAKRTIGVTRWKAAQRRSAESPPVSSKPSGLSGEYGDTDRAKPIPALRCEVTSTEKNPKSTISHPPTRCGHR
jgi:hypothetical protein